MAAEMNEQGVLSYPAICKHAYHPAKTPILIQRRSAARHPGLFPSQTDAANAANAMRRTKADSVTIE